MTRKRFATSLAVVALLASCKSPGQDAGGTSGPSSDGTSGGGTAGGTPGGPPGDGPDLSVPDPGSAPDLATPNLTCPDLSGLLLYFPFDSDWSDQVSGVKQTASSYTTATAGWLGNGIALKAHNGNNLPSEFLVTKTLDATALTLCAWIRVDPAAPTDAPLPVFGLHSLYGDVILGLSTPQEALGGDRLLNSTRTRDGVSASASSQLHAGASFTFVCLAFSTTQELDFTWKPTVWLDGTVDTPSSTANTFFGAFGDPTQLLIGGDALGGNNIPEHGFDGVVDEVSVWSRLLSSDEVRSLWNGGAGCRVHVACHPACTGKQCGDDGCGGSCGTCSSPAVCTSAGQCLCTPKCTGKVCGEDGCGGSCGTCASGSLCSSGTCVVCTPNCAGKNCGSDGCGGSCGTCATTCSAAGVCCVPNCAGKSCGSDGCGGSCGTCASGKSCSAAGTCVCVPNCANKKCGSDGCGGSCGTCISQATCSASGQCVLTCLADGTLVSNDNTCGSKCCTGSCNCSSGSSTCVCGPLPAPTCKNGGTCTATSQCCAPLQCVGGACVAYQ